MKVTFKTLYQQVFTLELEPQITVLGIKEKIQKEQGHSIDLQKIIYAGMILKDEDTLGALKYQERDFMVLMVTKSNNVKKKETSEADLASNTTSKCSSTPNPSSGTATKTETSPVRNTVNPSVESYSESTLTTGEHYDNAVKRLMEMGFLKPHVVLAMRAAFNNPDRAAEYLVSGIPSHIREGLLSSSISTPSQPGETEPSQHSDATGDPGANFMGTTGDPNANLIEATTAEAARVIQSITNEPIDSVSPETREQLEQLVNSPQFNQIRQMIASDPQMILPILRQLGKINPKLFQFLTTNQDQLFRFVGEDPGTHSGVGEIPSSRSWSGHNPSTIYITTEENAAIERLSALGFERSLAIEAFFACDKNEELAANYLFNLGQGLN